MRGCGTIASARASLVALVALACGSPWAPGVALSSTKHVAPSPKLPFAYNTSGAVGIGAAPGSVSGPAVLQFQGVSGATFDPNSARPIDLGQFVATPSSTALGRSTTYAGTPFEVEIQAPEFDRTKTVPVLDKVFPTFGKKFNLKTVVENSLLLKGHLDGTVAANGRANVTATVDSIKLGSMEAPSQDHATHFAFPIRFGQLKLPPSWTMSTSAPITVANRTPAAQAQLLSDPPKTSIGAAAIAPPPAAQMLATNPTPTPEPSTLVTFALALGGLVLGRRRLAAR